MSEISSLVILAGLSSRMGKPKQHVRISGRSFLERIIDTLSTVFAGLKGPMILVGSPSDSLSKRITESFPAVSQPVWLENPHPEQGSLSSIKLGLNAVPEGNAVLLWPVDHPMVLSSTVESLYSSWLGTPESIVVPSNGRNRGHPVIFPSWCRQELLKAPLEEGARWVLRKHNEKILHILTDDPWITRNINTPDQLEDAEDLLRKTS